MNKSIFNISKEYLDILDLIEEMEGEITPEVEELLKINEEELEDKLAAYVYRIKEWNATIRLAKDEISRLSNIIEANENKIKRLKDVVLDTVNLYGSETKSGGKQLKYLFANMYTSTTKALRLATDFINNVYAIYTPKLSIKEIEILNNHPDLDTRDDYYSNVSIDNKRLKDDILAGIEVEGAEVVTNTHVVIR